MNRNRMPVSMIFTLVLAIGGTVSPSFGETGGNDDDISGGGPRGFDPAACATTQSSGLTIGDIVSCAVPEPQEGPAAGLPGQIDPERFGRVTGADYAGIYGPEPKPLPFPDGCDTPVHGTWTQDEGVVNKISKKNGHTVFETTLNFHWTSGIGEHGRSIGHFDIWIEPDGYTVGVGRELFEGTIGGRTGSMTVWSVTFIEPTGRYVGRGFAIGGTEGLENVRMEAGSTGFAGKGGHWTPPSRVCFAD